MTGEANPMTNKWEGLGTGREGESPGPAYLPATEVHVANVRGTQRCQM